MGIEGVGEALGRDGSVLGRGGAFQVAVTEDRGDGEGQDLEAALDLPLPDQLSSAP